jgi:hypothetical protein
MKTRIGETLQSFKGCDINFLTDYLEQVAREKGVTVIAEELSEDALRKHGATKSIACTVALRLGIRHLFCDPGCAERKELGIRKNSEDAIELDKREGYWIKKLIELKDEDIIFLIGKKHIQGFSERAENEGFLIEIVEELYGSNFFSRYN